jgi:hypothetical protein
MNRNGITLERVGTTTAYLLAGAIGTAVVAIALTPVAVPLQRAVYGSLQAQLGPWRATEAAVLLAGAIVGLVAIAVPTLVVTALRGQRGTIVPILAAFGAAFGVSVFVMMFVAVLGLLGLPTALTVLVAAVAVLVAVPYYLGTGVRPIATLAGGVPVFALLLLLLAVGLGWGGGYDLVAEERPGATGPAAEFEEAPAVRDDLFREANREGGDGEPATYRLPLRGYEGASSAARFLDSHGVRCPYLNANTGPSDSFLAEHDGRYYRVSCVAYGD